MEVEVSEIPQMACKHNKEVITMDANEVPDFKDQWKGGKSSRGELVRIPGAFGRSTLRSAGGDGGMDFGTKRTRTFENIFICFSVSCVNTQ